jgi:hypothetical protein
MKDTSSRWVQVALVSFAALFTGCASTRMTSQVNREVTVGTFRKVLVDAKFKSLEHRKLAEGRLCTELIRVASCECLKSAEVFFPGQEHTAEQIDSRLSELHVDAVLTLQPVGSGTSSSYVPQSSYTTGSATTSGGTVMGSSTTRTYGGYSVDKPWANYEAMLQSRSDGKVAWYATATSRGNAFAGWSDLINSATSATVGKLVLDGVLEKRAP